MQLPPTPPNEEARLESLLRTALLEGFLDHQIRPVVELAARLLDRPTAALSLLTKDRQVLRAAINARSTGGPRGESFCGHAILEPSIPMVVEDALLDPRFADNPVVTAEIMPVRFYAGMPVRSPEGLPVGALCVADTVPGVMSAAGLDVLRKLALHIEHIIVKQQFAFFRGS